jgi:flagellar basal-body rod protein FlgB
VPDYAPVRLDFGDALARARDELNAGQTGAAALEVLTPEVTPQRDVQGHMQTAVEVDTEVAEIAQNTLQYQALMKGLSKHLSILSLAISEGKR